MPLPRLDWIANDESPVPTFSAAFRINKTQRQLDFVDVDLETDKRLFVDPLAISQRADSWSYQAHRTILAFFQLVVDAIRAGHDDDARTLLMNLREPNETRLGFSRKRPQGAGIGSAQAEQLYDALRNSSAVKTGFLTSLEDCELLIEGISHDKISDLTTNVIRHHLVEYTRDQCALHGVGLDTVPLPPCFDVQSGRWQARYVELPVWRGQPVLLVPKSVVRFRPNYSHQDYYRHYVLEYLQAEELAHPTSGLVRTLNSGERRVYKKDLERRFPRSKEFLFEFSRQHPEVLASYRDAMARLEKTNRNSDVDEEDEREIADMLASTLRATPGGTDSASTYHNLMIGVVELLFFPELLYPVKEVEIHDGRKRIDISMQNSAHSGVFFDIPNVRGLPAPYVFFECKNYRRDIANPELDQMAGRFSPIRGKLGFVLCRSFEDRALFVQRCQDTARDHRGVIVPLDDQRVLDLLGLISSGRRREVDATLSRYVAEVWLA